MTNRIIQFLICAIASLTVSVSAFSNENEDLLIDEIGLLTTDSDKRSKLFGEQDGLFAISKKRDKTYIQAAAAYLSRTPYLGSNMRETRILPYVRADYRGRLFISPGLGIGTYLHNTDKLRVTSSLSYSFGRKGDETMLANDAGKIDGGVKWINGARIYLPFAAWDNAVTLPLGGDNKGVRYVSSLTTRVKINDKLRFSPGVRAGFRSKSSNNVVYGITEEQALQAGLSQDDQFEVDGGLMTLSAHIVGEYNVTDKWTFVGVTSYSALHGDAVDSPLSPKNDGLSFVAAVTRQF